MHVQRASTQRVRVTAYAGDQGLNGDYPCMGLNAAESGHKGATVTQAILASFLALLFFGAYLADRAIVRERSKRVD